MSGILIKHLKMPKIGEKRTLVIDGNGDVYVNGSMGVQRLVDYAVELPSDDLISRQAAIDAVQNRHMMLSKEKVLLINDLENLPSVEPKRGKWVLVCDNNGMHFICNKCGAWRYHQEQKFCGECGAKMEVTNGN